MNFKKNKKHRLLIPIFVIFLTIFLSTSVLITFIDSNEERVFSNKNIYNDMEKICEDILFILTTNTGETLNGDSDWEHYEISNEKIKSIGLKDGMNLLYNRINGIQEFGCLATGTKIKINKNEYKNIENIKLGDKILSYSLEHETLVFTKVVAINSFISDGVYSINNGLIKITDDHPLLVKNRYGKKMWCSINPVKSKVYYNYRNISRLAVGYKLIDTNKGLIDIISIKFVPSKQKVIGLQVEDNNHNFIANDLVVSNAEYTLCGYAEGVQRLDLENYIVLDPEKIGAFLDLDYDYLRNLLNVPIKYNFKITLQYGSNPANTVPADIDYSYSDYYAFKKQNVLVLPLDSGQSDLSNLQYGYIMVEVFYV